MRKLLIKLFGERGRFVRVRRNNGQLWCVVQDICSVLGVKNTSSLVKVLEKSMTCKIRVKSGRHVRKMLCVNKSGLYTIMVHSKKSDAVQFRKWLCADGLPKMQHKKIMTRKITPPEYEMPALQVVNY